MVNLFAMEREKETLVIVKAMRASVIFILKKWEKANNHCLNADLAIEGRKVEAKKQRMISNARIASTMLGREDHGIMTFMIYINACNFSCGVGGFCLDEYDKETETRVFRAESMEAISKVLEVVGVDK